MENQKIEFESQILKLQKELESKKLELESQILKFKQELKNQNFISEKLTEIELEKNKLEKKKIYPTKL